MSEIELQDHILRLALELQRLSAHEEREAEAILYELERDLKTLLQSRTLSEAGKREIAELVREAETAINARYATVAGGFDTHGLVLMVSEHTLEAMQGIGAVKAVTAETLASLAKNILIDGAPSAAWWGKQADQTAFRFAQQLRQGVINGETNERIVSRIVGRSGEPGIMGVARRDARALVHSSIMNAANDSRMATYRANARFIKGVRWLTALDGHVCPRCAAFDGQAWDLDGKKLPGTTLEFPGQFWLHWSDRCVGSPIPKSEADTGPTIGARASSQGPLPAGTTFQQFFARQSSAQQDAQFGKMRAQLFRDGKITVKDLVSGTGRELTLEQLRRKVPA